MIFFNCKGTPKRENIDIKNMFGQQIIISPDAGKILQDVAYDLKIHLKKSTGLTFKITKNHASVQGIFLLTEAQAKSKIKGLDSKKLISTESFGIQENEKKLIIFAKSESGIGHGVYYFLEQLGFRWFLPGEEWTIVPKVTSLNKNISKIVNPDFPTRNFFGGGGFRYPKQIDPDRQIQKEWEDWKRRNRFGEELIMSGHSWEGFNNRYKTELLKHPEYLAEVNGKRVKWKPSAKFCISNQNIIDLYLKDRINQYEKQMNSAAAKQNESAFQCISVDPSDGSDHCQCSSCRKMGSVSDRVFYLANYIAKNLKKKYPEAKVNLLAYNEHASVPKQSLEPNIWVMTVPYAFQAVGSPETMIEDWTKKSKQTLVYDYFSILQWNSDLPGFDFIEDMPQKLRYWKRANLKGVKIESSYSKGAIGIGLYLFSKLAWDVNADENKLLEEFYEFSFKEAKAPMRRMLERWSGNFSGQSELPFAYRDLKKAQELAKDESVKNRIAEWEAYLIYTDLFLAYNMLPRHSKERAAKAEELLQYMWSITHTKMVHVSFMSYWIVNQLEKKSPNLKKKWTLLQKDLQASTWSNIQMLSNKTINKKFKQKEAQNKPVYQQYYLNKNSQSIKNKRITASSKVQNRDIIPIGKHIEFTLKGKSEIQVQTNEKSTLKLTLNAIATANPYKVKQFSHLTVLNDRQKIIFQQNIGLGQGSIPISIQLPKAGNYLIRLSMRFADTKISLDAIQNLRLSIESLTNFRQLPKKIFLDVSEDINEIVFEVKKGCKLQLFNQNGQLMTTDKLKPNLQKVEQSKWKGSNRIEIKANSANFKVVNIEERYHLNW
jgi:hypothetical protein